MKVINTYMLPSAVLGDCNILYECENEKWFVVNFTGTNAVCCECSINDAQDFLEQFQKEYKGQTIIRTESWIRPK